MQLSKPKPDHRGCRWHTRLMPAINPGFNPFKWIYVAPATFSCPRDGENERGPGCLHDPTVTVGQGSKVSGWAEPPSLEPPPHLCLLQVGVGGFPFCIELKTHCLHPHLSNQSCRTPKGRLGASVPLSQQAGTLLASCFPPLGLSN